jgi:hypothetical protein
MPAGLSTAILSAGLKAYARKIHLTRGTHFATIRSSAMLMIARIDCETSARTVLYYESHPVSWPIAVYAGSHF